MTKHQWTILIIEEMKRLLADNPQANLTHLEIKIAHPDYEVVNVKIT